MTGNPYKKKLIEVALPLDAIGASSEVETANPFIKGHPKSLKWWTRKPQAAARAVLFCQLVDDPSERTEFAGNPELEQVERDRLLRMASRLSEWGSNTDDSLFREARELIFRDNDGIPPAVLDPFSGGGTIPLEAARLGLGTSAMDLNPIAALLAKCLVEIPARWNQQGPFLPDAERSLAEGGSYGLAADLRVMIRRVASLVRLEYEELYEPSDIDGTVAWLSARCFECPNPSCRVPVPMVSSFKLSSKKGKETWVWPEYDERLLRFRVGRELPVGLDLGTKSGRGGNFTCPSCGTPSNSEFVSRFGRQSGFSEVPMVRITRDASGIVYRVAEEWVTPHPRAAQDSLPIELADDRRVFWFKNYGFDSVPDLFSPRQRVVIEAVSKAILGERDSVAQEARGCGLSPADSEAYARDICLLGLQVVSRMVMFHNALCGWNRTNQNVANPFSLTAPVFSWEYAEANPFDGSLSIESMGDKIAEVIEATVLTSNEVHVQVGDALRIDEYLGGKRFAVSTDPPYYDNATYSDQADIFYQWLREPLRALSPELATTLTSPKATELVSNRARFDSAQAADAFFESGFRSFAERLMAVSDDRVPVTIYYAFRQTEKLDAKSGLTSTGWASMLEALVGAGWSIVCTWPLRTERKARSRNQGSNALASSILLVCRPRTDTASVTDRLGFLRALYDEIQLPLALIQENSIAPVDLRQAAIGPGMAVFTRFGRVVEGDGATMSIKTALGLINQVVDSTLSQQDEEFDADTRWALQWFAQYQFESGPFGVAEQLAVAMDVSVKGIEVSGIAEAVRGEVRLFDLTELSDDWKPSGDNRLSVWEATHRLARALEHGGEVSAASLLSEIAVPWELCQRLAYRLFDLCERPGGASGVPYNALATSWPEVKRLAGMAFSTAPTFKQQTFDA